MGDQMGPITNSMVTSKLQIKTSHRRVVYNFQGLHLRSRMVLFERIHVTFVENDGRSKLTNWHTLIDCHLEQG